MLSITKLRVTELVKYLIRSNKKTWSEKDKRIWKFNTEGNLRPRGVPRSDLRLRKLQEERL